MDEFGFFAAARAGLGLFEEQSRRTGRTSRLIERVTLDDQVVVPNDNVAHFIRIQLRAAGKDGARVIVCPSGLDPREKAGTAPHGRTFFEHSWTHAYVLDALRSADDHLELLQRALSKTWPEAPTPADASGDRMIDFARRRW